MIRAVSRGESRFLYGNEHKDKNTVCWESRWPFLCVWPRNAETNSTPHLALVHLGSGTQQHNEEHGLPRLRQSECGLGQFSGLTRNGPFDTATNNASRERSFFVSNSSMEGYACLSP